MGDPEASRSAMAASHRVFKDKAKNRVEDLQGMFADLQTARKENRAADFAVLEEQVQQMLREWKDELNQPSPATSLHGNVQDSSDFLSSEILRMLQLSEEEDDATSKLAGLAFRDPSPKQEEGEVPKPVAGAEQGGENVAYHDGYCVNLQTGGQELLYVGQYQSDVLTGPHDGIGSCLDGTGHLHFQQYNLQAEISHDLYANVNPTELRGDMFPHMSDLLPAICPQPCAFLRPKCALWDCPRPAQGSDWCQDYCSSFHATLAYEEGPPGMTPVLRPGGIDLKDGPLFAALTSKTQGKNVGVPVCEGAATAKSPWNASELFDLSVLEGESLREWLFFDKPRRAFESGSRKQRSLPDYSGRGWHESRKQVMEEFGGSKRSYYMDPQPLANYEWHLFEYELSDCEAFALYRLEFKLVHQKKNNKAKVSNNSVGIQQQMGSIYSDNSPDNKKNAKSRSKTSQKGPVGQICSASKLNSQKNSVIMVHASDSLLSLNTNSAYGPNLQCDYSNGSIYGNYST